MAHILLIDDEELVRSVFSAMLNKLGHTGEVIDGPGSIESDFDFRQYDLIFADRMKGRHSDYLVPELRGLGVSGPIVAITGNPEAMTSQESGSVDAVMRKPFALEDLADAIENVLAKEA